MVIILLGLELLLIAVWGMLNFATVPAAMARLSGDRLLADSYLLSVGDLATGAQRIVELRFHNHAD